MNDRTIKFRVWDTRIGKFLEERWNGISFLSVEWGDHGWKDVGEFLQRETFIVHQYTGLKDSEGRDVYEGDIIENTKYDSDTGLKTTHKYLCKWSGNGFMWSCTGKNKIIGNVLETPVPDGSCCNAEERSMDGCCMNCGDPCL